MNLTQEQKTKVLAALGYKPYEADLVVGPDGVDVVETPTESRGFKDTLAILGSRLPREALATAGGLGAAALAEPTALKAAALGAKVPGHPLIKGGAGALAHMAVSAPAFAAGNTTARELYDNSDFSKGVDQLAFGSLAQKMRAEMEHPWVTTAANLGGQLMLLQANNPLKVGGALAKLLRPGMLARGEMGAITTAEQELLRNTARNAAGGGIVSAGTDIVHGEKPTLSRIGEAMVEGAMFGLPRGFARKALAPFTSTAESKAVEKFPEIPEPKPQEAPPEIKPDVQVTLQGYTRTPDGRMVRVAEPMDHPPFNPDDAPGVNVARATGRLAEDMAQVREQGGINRQATPANLPELPPGYAGPSTAEPYAYGPQRPVTVGPETPPGFAGSSAGYDAPIGPPNKRQLQYFLENLDPRNWTMRPKAPVDSTADYTAPDFMEPGRTEAEMIQDRLEQSGARYQPAKKESATPLDAEREALRRRGLSFEETNDPIVMPDGSPASGSFDRATGKIKISMPKVQEDTHVHEGMHAEVLDMLKSDNPRVRAAGRRILDAVKGGPDPEETIVEGATAASRGARGQNELVRAVKDAWNYFRTTKLGGADVTPERMARILAERFDYARPHEQKGGGQGEAYQSWVPGSVVGKAGKEDAAVGKAALDMSTARDQLHGAVNMYLEQLSKIPREVVNSMAWKRSRAGQFKTTPNFTPDEARANAIYQKVMDITAAEATKHGYEIEQRPNYVPEMAGVEAIRAYEKAPDATGLLPEFHKLNQAIQGAAYDPIKGEEYFRKYLAGAAKAPNSLGSDFGALTKDARYYHLPDNFREYDQLRNLQRYVNRWATGVAKKAHILNNPYVAQRLGYGENVQYSTGAKGPVELSPAMNALKQYIDDVMFNQGRGTSGVSQDVRDVVMGGQQAINAMTMQTLSNVKNTLAKVPFHMINAQHPEQAMALVKGALEPVLNYRGAVDRAMSMNVIKPNTDPAFDTSAPLGTQVARKLAETGQTLRKYTGSQFLEEFNRAQDFAIGENLAKVNIELAKQGNADALRFLDQFDYGTGGDRVANIARNYAKASQGTYSGEGLPAPMVKGGFVGSIMRIQRFGIENFNRTRQMVIEPAKKGEYGPLLTYVLGLALTAPIIKKVTELFSGRPSGLPTDEEIKAGNQNYAVEKILNVMSMAQISGAFGFAGNLSGAVSQNARGNAQAVVGDPSVSFAADLIKNLTMAAGAVKAGEPVIPVLEEVFKRSVLDHMQLARTVTTDRAMAEDTRNKRVFELQNGQHDVSGAQVAAGLMFGDLGSDRVPKISPTFEAAKNGDPAAIAKLSPREQALLDNYKGGYEDADKEQAYQAYILKTQGPDALRAYIQRRVDALRRGKRQ